MSPDRFLESTLGGLLGLVEGVTCLALEAADKLLTEILKLAVQILDAVYDVLTLEWDVPYVSELYSSFVGNSLTALDLAALIAAVPATTTYKELYHSAPFPDEESVDAFKAVFNTKSLLEGNGLPLSSEANALSPKVDSSLASADSQKKAAQFLQIAAWVTDVAHHWSRLALDANKLNPDPENLADKVLSTVNLAANILGHIFKVPLGDNVSYKCTTKEGLEHQRWRYECYGPLLFDCLFFIGGRRIARATSIWGPVISTLLSAGDAGLVVKKWFASGDEPVLKVVLDLMTVIPEFLGILRLSSSPIAVAALVIVDRVCGGGALTIAAIMIANNATAQTAPPSVLQAAERH